MISKTAYFFRAPDPLQKRTEGFDVVLANPPFKGSLDFEDVHLSLLRKVRTKKTELLFVALIVDDPDIHYQDTLSTNFTERFPPAAMELAEPRVRNGVWERTTFRADPIRRLRRTGLAAMVTVYGAAQHGRGDDSPCSRSA